jgi:phosphate:Na+ symporter
MAIVTFLISLFGATMLLLFAVRMVRTGIERSYGASFKRLLTGQRNQLQGSLMGMGMAVILQSSAAVALLAAGFAAGGLLNFGMGLAIVLGGDLGSALIIQILSFNLDWLVPLLLAVGGGLFVKTESRKWRQMGRILMGIAFILISLRFLREAMDPIRDSAFLPAIAAYLERDFVTAFLVGAALAFVMHSSVAAILMCVTLVQIGAIPFVAGLSLVLGANFGSAFIPVWLTRGMDVAARRIPLANLFLRGSLAIAILFFVQRLFSSGLAFRPEGGQMLVYAHIGFNALLLVLALPFCNLLAGPMARLLPAPGAAQKQGLDLSQKPVSVLDKADLEAPSQALTSLKRELLRMVGMVETMFRPVLSLYEKGDKEAVRALKAMDQEVNACLSGIRSYVAAIPRERFGKENTRTALDLAEYAIRLETAGDVVSERLAVLADQLHKMNARFSREGWGELVDMHEAILSNLKLASNVLVSDDLESARLLSLEKTELKRAEAQSRKKHLKRLQQGSSESFETSDIHLETLRALREFNSHIAAVAYPILYRNGQLLETRLIENMPKEQAV